MAQTTRRRRTAGSNLASNVTQVIRDLSTENRKLQEEVTQLRSELQAIQAALTGANGRRGRGRPRGRGTTVLASAPPRPRKAITDPDVLAKRRDALAKARRARSEKLAKKKTSGARTSTPLKEAGEAATATD